MFFVNYIDPVKKLSAFSIGDRIAPVQVMKIYGQEMSEFQKEYRRDNLQISNYMTSNENN